MSRYTGNIFVICILVGLIQQKVSSQRRTCPEAPTFPSSELTKITGEWIEVQTLHIKEHSSQQNMEAESPLCTGYKIESLRNDKMNFKLSSTSVRTNVDARRVNSARGRASANRDVIMNGWFQITEENEAFKMESFVGRNRMAEVTYVDREYDADLYYVVVDINPDEHILMAQCRVQHGNKQPIGTLQVLSRRVNDTFSMSDDDMTWKIHKILQNNHAQMYKNIYSSTECYKSTHNYNW